MKTVAIIQARMGSTRLPGKVLCELDGKPMLHHILHRVMASKTVDAVCVATTDLLEDAKLLAHVREHFPEVIVYGGSENDVLDRFYQASKLTDADIVVRVTADDPLKDPEIIDQAVALLKEGGYDYVSNTMQPTFPEGLDIEVFRSSVLGRAWNEAKLGSEREHVTPYIWKNPSLFKVRNFVYEKDLSQWRWTVDKPQDLEFMREVYKACSHGNSVFSYRRVIEYLNANPQIMKINMGTLRNEGYLKSLSQEEKGE